jgi:suppressor for copper-sensitivity B
MVSGKIAQGLAILLGLLTLSQPARAISSNEATTEFGSARLVSAVSATGMLDRIPLGLQLRLPQGWKTYWRSPGDAGLPARIDWKGSQNLAEATMRWPIPERFSLFGLESYGYEHEVVLPIDARPATPGTAMTINATVDWLVCKEICVPLTAELRLALPAGAAQPTEFAHLIDRFSVRVPSPMTARGLAFDEVAADGAMLRVTARSDAPFSKPDLMIEGPEGVGFGKPEIERRNGVVRFTLPVLDATNASIVGKPLTLTLTDGDRALEAQATPTAATGRVAGGELLAMLLTAVLGGLILNLMPCVLPVLSIKLLGLVGHGGGAPRQTRFAFFASAAGILASFAVLATAAIALKAAGIAVGWGMQFQEPLFLVFMIVVLTLFAANLWGLFEILLPARFAGVLGDADAAGLAGHFLTGALATLLATPCSAPFLGTAIAFALSRGAGEIYAIFAALGFGLALPYLAVAAVPGVATRLPHPGHWMVTLRRVLALALAGTTLWLLWVLASSSGVSASLAIAAVLVAMVATLALLPHARAAVAALALLAFVIPPALGRQEAPVTVADNTLWQAFDRAAIQRLVKDGKTVLVDVTADWCLTCQVNKKLALNDASVAARLGRPDVVALRADWTRPNEAIADYLAGHGRYGIPFNVVYGPGRPDGVVLPELLTASAVLEALESAAKR